MWVHLSWMVTRTWKRYAVYIVTNHPHRTDPCNKRTREPPSLSLPPISEPLNRLSPLPATYSFNTDWLAAGEKIGMVDTFLLKSEFPTFKPFKTFKTFTSFKTLIIKPSKPFKTFKTLILKPSKPPQV